MKILIKEEDVIPPQSLEHKAAISGVITHVFPCNKNGVRLKEDYSKETEQVIVKFGGELKGNIIYSREDFENFRGRYSVVKLEHLEGLPVLAVYETKGRSHSTNPTGLIPLADKIEIQREQ